MRKNGNAKSTIIFVGQSAIDVYPIFDVPIENIQNDKVILSEGLKKVVIPHDEWYGGKSNSLEDFSQSISDMDILEEAGGGYWNSAMAYLAMEGSWGNQRRMKTRNLSCIDTNKPTKMNGSGFTDDYLSSMGINNYFCCFSETPRTLCLSAGANEKALVRNKSSGGKGASLPEDKQQKARDITRRLEPCETIFTNSLKNMDVFEILADYVRKNQKNMYNVLTKSVTEWDFIKDVLQLGTTISGYDDFSVLTTCGKGNENSDDDLRELFDNVLVGKLYQDGINKHHCIHITAGRNGSLVFIPQSECAYHVRLKPEKCEGVQARLEERKAAFTEMYKKESLSSEDYVKNYLKGAVGVGDTYAAAVAFYQDERKCEPVSTAINASIESIMYLGYDRRISAEDFEVKIYNPKVSLQVRTSFKKGSLLPA